MKTTFAITVSTIPLLGTAVASAQTGGMMDGSMWNGGWMSVSGMWVPVLLVVAVVGLLVWALNQKGK